jgi:hypothetical protein
VSSAFLVNNDYICVEKAMFGQNIKLGFPNSLLLLGIVLPGYTLVENWVWYLVNMLIFRWFPKRPFLNKRRKNARERLSLHS